jgi:hypothetical protein
MIQATSPHIGTAHVRGKDRPGIISAILAIATFLSTLGLFIVNVLTAIGKGLHDQSRSHGISARRCFRMKLYTIGFTKKSAQEFFGLLQKADVARVVDVRLNNVSQLAGFTKAQDFPYFLREVAGIGYRHAPELAPTKEMLDAYKKHGGGWPAYETAFNGLMRQRHVEATWADALRDSDCLLCSEEKAIHCHRRLVAEYIADRLGNIEVTHLG